MLGNWVCVAGSRTPESGVAEEVASMMPPYEAVIEKGIGYVGIKHESYEISTAVGTQERAWEVAWYR